MGQHARPPAALAAPVDLFWTALPELFRWLSGAVLPPLLPSHPIAVGATVLRDPAGGIRVPGRSTPFIEVIRFAASNHLLIELDYRDEEGNRRTRAIELYSLRRTKDDNILLCAVNADKQEARSYRVERIQAATIVNRSFPPRFQIELTPSGSLVAPDTSRSAAVAASAVAMSGTTGLPGFGCFTPTLERENPDDRDEPAAAPHGRGHNGPQSVAGNSAIVSA